MSSINVTVKYPFSTWTSFSVGDKLSADVFYFIGSRQKKKLILSIKDKEVPVTRGSRKERERTTQEDLARCC